MAYINNDQLERLISVEKYLWNHTDWKTNEDMERALFNLWSVIEELEQARYEFNDRAKNYMRGKRAENPQYGRAKK